MKRQLLFTAALFCGVAAFAQQFEEPKIDASKFEKLNVRVGGDFALQYQALNHEADAVDLIKIGSNLNLPTANMVIEADLAPGIRVNLTTYLSSRHHNEAWVKGGYLVLDKLPFLPVTDKIMEYVTIKAGTFQPSVGDQVFRRSDNGSILNNVFVGNYIWDDMTTNTGFELLYRNNGLIGMVGVNNGALNPSLGGTQVDETTGKSTVFVERNLVDQLAYVWKLGYDKQVNDDLRLRATVSGFSCAKSDPGVSFHASDRAGSRYYFVMLPQSNATAFTVTSNQTTGNFGPGTGYKDNTIIANLFAQYKGFEIFGTYEQAKGEMRKMTATSAPYTYTYPEYSFSQIAVEGVYRFGKAKQWQLGARYNVVKEEDDLTDALKTDLDKDYSVDRIQLAAGWYMTKNIVTKLEYVKQNYNNWKSFGDNAGFDGFMFEAGISF